MSKKAMKHIDAFQKKYNVGLSTFGLLTLFAVESNVLAAMNMYPGI